VKEKEAFKKNTVQMGATSQACCAGGTGPGTRRGTTTGHDFDRKGIPGTSGTAMRRVTTSTLIPVGAEGTFNVVGGDEGRFRTWAWPCRK